jgi:alkanesulfonate monooxygenase SsuD/methylene tetrahydromethanopterin reductase-like flavin-dependent oxidoreductase (luciferase family)
VEYGAHLPILDLGVPPSLDRLTAFARTAAGAGCRHLCANDHLVFRRPWLDGLAALAAVVEASGDLTLATTVALPVIRGPAPLAKAVTALDVLSGGRVLVGVGPGSSAADYAAAGIPFEERWRRFDEAVPALRSLLHGDPDGFEGAFYSTRGVVLEPRPVQRPGPPVWVASWGSGRGLRRAWRMGDGWLASAYNTTPARFAEAAAGLPGMPNGIATAWTLVTEDAREADRAIDDLLAPLLGRDPEALRALSLPIGPPERCAERVRAFADAGAQRMFLWPLRDEARQLELFMERVAPLVAA